MRKLKLMQDMNRDEQKRAVEAALLLGFQSESALFPIAGIDGEITVPGSLEQCMRLWTPEKPGEITVETYEAASAHPGEIFHLDFRKECGLEGIFESGMFLKDENHDFLPDRLDVKIVLPEPADISVVTAACNLAFRLGMETTGINGPIIAEKGAGGNLIVFDGECQEEELSAAMYLERKEDAVLVHIQGSGANLEAFTAELCNSFPRVDSFRSLTDVMMDLTDDMIFRGADGQMAYLKACCDRERKTEENGKLEALTLYGSPRITGQQMEAFPEVTYLNYKSGRKVYEKRYELPWEVEVLEKILEEQIYPQLQEGDRLRIEGALSENRHIRLETAEKIRKQVQACGAEVENVSLLCAYKQGYSWVEEVILPMGKEKKPDRVEIYFKPFLPEGETEWVDENGATPSYHNLKADDPEKWYDLPIRYLQELYPIEDRIAKEWGMERSRIEFRPYTDEMGDEKLTYLCRAYRDNKVCLEETYEARCSERPYLDAYPQMGKVHPATGYLRVWKNEREVLCERIRTDVEAIWDLYQSEVLPDCRSYIEKKTGGKIRQEAQPFFHELLLDVTVSEPDERTGSREDMISSLDALHEDMYFAGSDYFKNYGVQTADVMLDAPGLILPKIHQGTGKPVFRVVLSEQLREKPCICRKDEVLYEEQERNTVSAKIDRVVWRKGAYEAKNAMELEISVEGAEERVLAAYAELLEAGRLERTEDFRRFGSVMLKTSGGRSWRADLRQNRNENFCEKTVDISSLDLHEKEVISYEMYLDLMRELKKIPELEVFRTAVSYTGRELYGIWLKPKYEGYLSMTKRLTCHPSEIINARHHANEVSSTNASFLLLRTLLLEERYRELPEKLNLVLVPMENVDGAAIHYELQKEHPYWKLHVARFNALGKEFYHEHFRQDTIHTEAMGLTRLFARYVPDMIVDNHGVPSHEWEQQFSGYTSPSYKGFWLPRSLLYGYFWYVTNSEYMYNYALNKEMEDVIADKIAEDEEMTRWNRQWSAQFEKYAHAWLPKLFPADYYKNMINYWIPFAADPNHRYPSIRFPWITTVAYTSEVADETAQGDYLYLCARAHVAHDEATIQMLMQAGIVYDCWCECCEKGIFARYERQRPIVSGEKIN